MTSDLTSEQIQYEIRVCAEASARMLPDYYNLIKKTDEERMLRHQRRLALRTHAWNLGCWGMRFDCEVQDAFTRIFGFMAGSKR